LNASLERCLPGVTVPVLLVQHTGDCSVFPGDVAASLATLANTDVTHVQVRCDTWAGHSPPATTRGSRRRSSTSSSGSPVNPRVDAQINPRFNPEADDAGA
jgi:hypothetical protein